MHTDGQQGFTRKLATASRATPAVVFAVAAAATLLLWRSADQRARETLRHTLERAGGDISLRVRERLEDDEQILLGGLGLFQAGEVDRGAWRRYVASLRMEQKFPGIQGVGYAVWLSAAELEAHQAAVRAEGFPEYVVRPAGPRPHQSSIVFLEPFDWRNQRAFGYDMYSEPTRRAAMDQAADSGDPALSGPVVLVQETDEERQAGVLLYVPVYRAGAPQDSREARRAALRGWVYSPIRVGNLVRASLHAVPPHLAFSVHDAGGGQLLHESHPASKGGLPAPARETYAVTQPMLGQRWRFEFAALPGFGEERTLGRPEAVLWTGLVASLLLALVGHLLQRSARERDLADAAEHRRILFEASADGMVVLDPANGRILEFNTAAHMQLGYAREEFARLSVSDLEAVETAEETRAHLAEVLRTGWADFETVQRTRQGERRHVHVTVEIVEVLGQQVYQAIWRDVTERRRAEDALRAAQRQLQRLGDNLPGGYVFQLAVTPDGTQRFTYVSNGVEQVHGVKPEELLRDPLAVLRLASEAERERVRGVAERALRSLVPFSTEFEVRSPKGDRQWIRLSSTPLSLPDGVVQWDGVAIDVTDRVRADEDRLVVSKLESTGILAGGIAHDFNNLLTTMRLGVDVARTPGPTAEEVRDALEEVVQAIAAARELTQQLITFSRGGEPVRRRAELEPVVRGAVALALTGTAVSGRVTVAQGLWPAEVDTGQLGQVVRNLVLNAREAMQGHGVVAVALRNVTLGAGEHAELVPGPYVELVVSDQGPGIPPDVLPRIFDPYFSTKLRGPQKGMGLGLTICHAVVQKHGGAITAGAAPGGGASFRVLLPARPGEAAEAPPALARPKAPGHRRGRVLVMDDEEGVRRQLATALGQLGCEVLLASEGAEAVERWRAEAAAGRPLRLAIFDLTVRDGVGGLEAARRLHAVDPAARAVLMSGFSDSAALANPAAYGFGDALPKPFDLEGLRAMLARNLPA
ncbi:MAG: CHASE domain-containing protein [Anaeromyxobacter sp.]